MSFFGKPQVMIPPASAATQEVNKAPAPPPDPSAPAVQEAVARTKRKDASRQGRNSTILTSGLGLSPTTPVGSTLLGS